MATPETPQHRPAVGTKVLFRWRKWDGGIHWQHDCVYLGRDEHGDWVGQPAGWRSHRPGRDFLAAAPNVTLVPPDGDYACTLNAEGVATRVYIDLAWDVRFSDSSPELLVGIDMDLDVVDTRDERGLFIDDRDEWDEHRVRYGYPAEVVAHLEAKALELERRVGAGAAPFDEATAASWLARLDSLGEL